MTITQKSVEMPPTDTGEPVQHAYCFVCNSDVAFGRMSRTGKLTAWCGAVVDLSQIHRGDPASPDLPPNPCQTCLDSDRCAVCGAVEP